MITRTLLFFIFHISGANNSCCVQKFLSLVVFRFSYLSGPHEEVSLEPLAAKFLFNPTQLHVSVGRGLFYETIIFFLFLDYFIYKFIKQKIIILTRVWNINRTFILLYLFYRLLTSCFIIILLHMDLSLD